MTTTTLHRQKKKKDNKVHFGELRLNQEPKIAIQYSRGKICCKWEHTGFVTLKVFCTLGLLQPNSQFYADVAQCNAKNKKQKEEKEKVGADQFKISLQNYQGNMHQTKQTNKRTTKKGS